MKGRVDKQDGSLNGVKCVVNTCYYYESGNQCTASGIEIQPQNAKTTQETDCATFTPKG
ncbi:protein of unknown function DUF1540 [Candidatus Syntrophocurvum alkaliphilum]|uniref:DUF1540 domain-containing protein n=1 Tax=Candidatus Syntrophocurvum alkaliphilum TaxID=2293317 RepID=A0A6I6DAN1_9FIRM|nr:DUF1540 domain-containing protein [Candidatus Syntrophocurvum alkaliphilum]QGT99409.1 protein of unknown function DUF1540 [Candidatus Syntrophocurvum alkaliphilum]